MRQIWKSTFIIKNLTFVGLCRVCGWRSSWCYFLLLSLSLRSHPELYTGVILCGTVHHEAVEEAAPGGHAGLDPPLPIAAVSLLRSASWLGTSRSLCVVWRLPHPSRDPTFGLHPERSASREGGTELLHTPTEPADGASGDLP